MAFDPNKERARYGIEGARGDMPARVSALATECTLRAKLAEFMPRDTSLPDDLAQVPDPALRGLCNWVAQTCVSVGYAELTTTDIGIDPDGKVYEQGEIADPTVPVVIAEADTDEYLAKLQRLDPDVSIVTFEMGLLTPADDVGNYAVRILVERRFEPLI